MKMKFNKSSFLTPLCFFILLFETCDSLNNNGSKLLTCNVFFKEADKAFDFYLVPANNLKKRITISHEAQKIYWDICTIIIQESNDYLLVNVINNNNNFSVKKFLTYQSLEDFFYKTYGTEKRLKLVTCSGVYSLLAN